MARNLFVLRRMQTSQILLMHGEHGWTIPEIETPRSHKWWRETQAVNAAIATQYGLSVVVLACLHIYHSETCAARVAVFSVEDQDKERDPVQGTWVLQPELMHREFADPRHRGVLLETLARVPDTDASPLMPWERSGWFERAAVWIANEAAKHGHVLSGPVVQVRNHGYMSCVLRAPTADGSLYLKACPPMWAQEPALTVEIAGRHGSMVPRVLGVLPEERWLLTVGVENQKLNTLSDREQYLSLWTDLLTAFGRMQVGYVRDRERLIALGCPDWRLERLSTFIRYFLLDRIPAINQEHSDFPEWRPAQLEQAAARLGEYCSRLATYNIPETLHHGDFHSANILTDGRSCRIVDWAFQAGVTHPFFFMSVVFEEHEDPSVRAHLRDHYLSIWTDFEPMDRLIEAFELAQALSHLHAAIGHYVQLSAARMPWEKGPDREALGYYLDHLITLTDA